MAGDMFHVMNKSKELGEIFMNYFNNDTLSIKYINDCKNGESLELYGCFYLVNSDSLRNRGGDKNQESSFVENITFLSFCYMNKLIEKYYNNYNYDDKINIRNNFINALFGLSLEFNHSINMDMLNVKEKSLDLFKKHLMEVFINQNNNYLMSNFMNCSDCYYIRSYSNSTRNKYSQILSIICIYNDYTYFRYLYNFILYFMVEFLKKKMEYITSSGGNQDPMQLGQQIHETFFKQGNEGIEEKKKNDYFTALLHISINFLKEIFYTITNDSFTNTLTRQQFNIFRTIIINDINELFNFIYTCFYYCILLKKKNEFILLMECIKELSFFSPIHLFFNSSSISPMNFLLNVLVLPLRNNKKSNGNIYQNSFHNSSVNSQNNEPFVRISPDEFNYLYTRYIFSQGHNMDSTQFPHINEGATNFLNDSNLQETILTIFSNIIEGVSKINSKTFLQINENELMNFLENFFNIDLNYYDIKNYDFENVYIKMIMNISGIPVSNYLHKKENKIKCIHMYIINIFKNIHHPNINILIYMLTICKNIFEKNRDLIFVKNNQLSQIQNEQNNMYKLEKNALLNDGNEKKYTHDMFVISIEDLKKLFTLIFIRYIKIPIYKNQNSLNKKLMIQFFSNYINEYNEEWFVAYNKHIMNESEDSDNTFQSDMHTNSMIKDNVSVSHNSNLLRQRICSLLKTLIGMNHEVYQIAVNVFCEFFKFYNNINVDNLYNEILKTKDYFVYSLLEMYYEMLTFLINTLKDCKNIVTEGNHKIHEETISYQLSTSTTGSNNAGDSKNQFIQDKKNMLISIDQQIEQLLAIDREKEKMQSAQMGGQNNGIKIDYEENENIKILREEKNNINLVLHIINCINKYQSSPYYEIDNNCINSLVTCYKQISENDFTSFINASKNFISFEIKRLEFISDNSYILNYTKEYAFFMMENLFKNILQNNNNFSLELKKNYFSIFSSIVENLKNHLTNDMIHNILKTFLEFKKSTSTGSGNNESNASNSFFKHNKEFSFFILVLISSLNVGNINDNVEYIQVIMNESIELLTNFNKQVTNFQSLYNFLYTDNNGLATANNLFDTYKIAQAFFSKFSYNKIERIINKKNMIKSSTFPNYGNTELSSDIIYKLANNNVILINENPFLQICMNLFSSSITILSIYNGFIHNDINSLIFEACPILYSDINYFYLGRKEREIAITYGAKNKSSKKNESFSNIENVQMKSNSNNNYGGVKKFGKLNFMSLHENACNVIKKYVEEDYIFINNNILNIFNDVLSLGLQHTPYTYVNHHILSIYLSLSQKVKSLIMNRNMNELIIDWFVKIFFIFFEKQFNYFKQEEEFIKKVNSHLSNEDDIMEEDYSIYCDMLYRNKKHIFNFFKICKNLFVIPSELSMSTDSSHSGNMNGNYSGDKNKIYFYYYLYNSDKIGLLNYLLPTFECLLNSYDCNVTKQGLSCLTDLSESICALPTFNSSNSFFILLQIMKTILQGFLLYNPPMLSLQQNMNEKKNMNNILFNQYDENNIDIYIGEMSIFTKNDPQEVNSFLNIFTSTFIKICKNYFLLQKNIFNNINENTSFNELVNIEPTKQFVLLLQNLGNPNMFDFQTIVSDLIKQNSSDYFKNLLINLRLHRTQK
ncbi:conserved Plasmodium protein, unknown function [Plasmodium chabaudi chabaudi]|uniref:Uncharacterized protein n=1 Tax=Plasmodium chabaudi chabaudi TaxID=31271 RepID=A0A4V0K487_PLACU|nr:conserved Plasmodium protein, unknown function [Plasmodium chabaudi chabaudi]VTZ67391.1 conserved Plasmodium protein, unknown function [Plasmodium chabaudi chabaudi]|eukprot:XP_736811.2 conserved Plasmodium protein, unknown function [Plasmodium chabaudi chabaudi]